MSPTKLAEVIVSIGIHLGLVGFNREKVLIVIFMFIIKVWITNVSDLGKLLLVVFQDQAPPK